MKADLEMERKLQDKLKWFCRYKCDSEQIKNTIFEMLHGDIEDAWLEGSVCKICMLKSFIEEIRDELR